MMGNWIPLTKFWIYSASIISCSILSYSVLGQNGIYLWNTLIVFLLITSILTIITKKNYKSYLVLSVVSLSGVLLQFIGLLVCVIHPILISSLFISIAIFSYALAIEEITLGISAEILSKKYHDIMDLQSKRYNYINWNVQNHSEPTVHTLCSQGITLQLRENNFEDSEMGDMNYSSSEAIKMKDGWRVSKYKASGDKYFTLKIRKIKEQTN